ncbi:ERF family protein [Pseudomonas sp. PH1b]|uniref:ERF family protein n=1 Tax=Pseudomonas sp. PH1b TaxID=1397282 RepID=UPI00046A0CFB|nr:ERF family protein [Pseudomonas sp. PH1b]
MSQLARVEQDQAPAVVGESATIMQVVLRAASDPQCDIEKMERLMAMHERMQAKTAETEFNAALSRVQGEMGRIAADATNNQTRSQYVTYGKLDSVLRPKYTNEGLSLSFSTEQAPEGMVGMVCFVSHVGGHTREYRAHIPSDGKGAKGGDVMTKTHAFGSGTSYGMRYLLKMIFNVAIGEEDDDGNGASGDEFRNAILCDLTSKVAAATDKAVLQEAWQHGLKVLHVAKDAVGAEELRAAVNKRKAELESAP